MTDSFDRLPRPDDHTLTYERIRGAGPTVVFCGGYGSDMTGSKATALADWARNAGRGFVRFDYFGHGRASGRFEDGTITRWRADALAVIDELTDGPLVLVGSSMGGWIACLLAAARADRLAGLVLIAPAVDFTEALVKPGLSDLAWQRLRTHGVLESPGGLPMTLTLLEDGARWVMLPETLPIEVPVRILHGDADDVVPTDHVLATYRALKTDDAVLTLIRDGDHSLSRPQDLVRLIAAVEEVSAPGL